jgi:hypothetical protein
VKTTRSCFVPRTARARATAAPRTTRPVALTPRRDRRRLWQEKQATLRLHHNNRVKKGTPRHSISYPFPFSSFSLLQQGPGKGDTPKRILPREGTRLRASLLIRGSKAGPPEGFDNRLRSRGPYTHYWSEVRRLAPRKGSTAASGYSGSAPITDQGFCNTLNLGYKISFLISTKFRCYPLFSLLFFSFFLNSKELFCFI